MKILLIGKTGQLGNSLIRLNEDYEIIAPSRELLDLRDVNSIRKSISTLNPDVIINTAAFHNLPECETHPLQAFACNFIAVQNLSLICKEYSKFLISFSTDYVFDGTKQSPYNESDSTNPLQIYGLSKAAGELAISKHCPDSSIIIRTCGLYGITGSRSRGGNFVDNRISDASQHAELEMSSDQTVTPTFTDDLANALFDVIKKRDVLIGILHLVNEGACSWADFTKEIYRQMSLANKVIPVNRGGYSGAMKRPLYSVLNNSRAKAHGITLPCWQDALSRFIKLKYKNNL